MPPLVHLLRRVRPFLAIALPASMALSLSTGVAFAKKPVHTTTASVLYVSPAGDDLWPGTKSEPIRTLTHARDVVRKRLPKVVGDFTVFLENGVYRLQQPLVLTSADSGRAGHRVIWTAAPSATPIVSGARQITGWTKYDNDFDIWSAPVPASFDTRQLYVNGARASIASGAVPTTLTQTAIGYTMSTPAMESWRNPSAIEFVYSQQLGQMVEPICPVASISATAITMAQPCWNNSTKRQVPTVTKWYDDNLVGWGTLGLPTYVENAFELLTRPGQFYLDGAAHVLYYIPRSGQNMTSADVEAPDLQTLMQGSGTEWKPIHDVIFRGIEFSDATWLQPSTNQGFSEVQTGYTLTGRNAYATQGLCHVISGGTCPYGSWTKEPGAVRFTYDQGVNFLGDRFVHLGAAGLDLGDGSQDDTVSASVFTDISGNGLEVGSVDLPNASGPRQTQSITVTDDHVSDIGVEFHGAAGMLIGYVARCTISHNQLDNLPYTGISIGWGGWLDKIGRPALPNFSHDNLIADNLIENYMQVLSDGGGIYTQGITGPSMTHGEKVEGNVIHDQIDWSFALHSDDGGANITYRGNALYGDDYEWCCKHANYTTHSGNYAQLFTGNYWQSGNYNARWGGVVEKDNHMIAGPADVPGALLASAGVQQADASVLTWQPSSDPVPQPPDHVGAVYAIDDDAYVTWHPALSIGVDPILSYTLTPCAVVGGIASEPCSDPGPPVTVSAVQFEANGYGVVTGLTPGTNYWFSITASNDESLSTPSNPSPVIVAGGHIATVPGAPTSVSYHTAPGLVSLKWSAPKSAACKGSWWAGTCADPILSYQVTVSNGATYVLSSLSQLIVSNGGGTAVAVVGGLIPGRAYRISISGTNPAGLGTPVTTGWITIPSH